jgi:tRNA acetyltransferase TAN1
VGRSGFDARPFNVVASAVPGETGRALEELTPLGASRATPYRCVLVGMVEPPADAAVRRAWQARPAPFVHVVRITPLEAVVPFTGDDVTEALCGALEALGPRVGGRTFHVRARLRGLKGRVESQAVERALGGFLLDLADRAGAPARVRFDDPDVVLVVEVVGKRAGWGLLDRATRAVPAVRPR